MTRNAAAPSFSARGAVRQFGRLLYLVRPYWRGLGAGLLLGVIIGVVSLVTPYMSKLFIDRVYPTQDVSLMHVLVLGVFTVSVISSLMGALRGYYSQTVSTRIAGATSLMFLNHLQHLPVRFYDQHRVGEVLSRFGDVRASLTALTNVIQTVLGSGVYLLVVPPFLFAVNAELAVLSLITVPLTAAVSAGAGHIVRRHWKQSAEASAELSAMQVEVMGNIRSLKATAAERHIYGAASRRVGASVAAQLKAGAVSATLGLATNVIGAAGTAAFTWYAWTLILRGEMSLGDYVAFAAYVGYLTGPAHQMVSLVPELQQNAITLGRMFEYLDEQPEQEPASAYSPAPTSTRAQGTLRLDRVSFSYAPGRPVLHDVSLVLRPGTITAIVGPSGAGKSSLLRLICRFDDPDFGDLTLDGKPYRTLDLYDLRRQVAVVWQEFAIIRGTLWDNLTLGLDASTDRLAERVDAAARVSRLEAMVRDLPLGYRTPVAEWGSTLSGGQRQRLAIARALVRDTPVLLLDEATSQIDVETEAAILHDLFGSVRDRTVLFVTHRVATARLADQICVMEDGRSVGVGSHQSLLGECDTYRRLVLATRGEGEIALSADGAVSSVSVRNLAGVAR